MRVATCRYSVREFVANEEHKNIRAAVAAAIRNEGKSKTFID